MDHLTQQEIAAYQPDPLQNNPLDQARRRMRELGLWSANQQMGRRWPVGCVALEITQRCNLDCTLCYLSEHSEAVRDLPLEEVFRRIDAIHAYYGPNTDVQITGGDPTLRKKSELLTIVRRVREKGMRATLMSNGIKATRGLLAELAEAGLVDVAFHVDTTQERKGYASEAALNAVRRQYIERARGLPLSVMFNTTIHQGNFHEIPALVGFFRANAAAIRTVSFQLQADTGRGVERQRDAVITMETVMEKIRAGAELDINFDGSRVGHPRCSRYALCLAVNGRLYDVFDDPAFIGRLQAATAQLQWPRDDSKKAITGFARWLLKHPRYLASCMGWVARKVWRMKSDLIAGGGRVHTLSFVIHNFMDACSLERERIAACVFKTMTADGPLSMCMHNAKRDRYILRPVALNTPQGVKYWQPLSGSVDANPQAAYGPDPRIHPLKRLKGRTRMSVLQTRSKLAK